MDLLFFGFPVIWIACGCLSAVVASSKGRSGCGWFLLGFVLGPLALLASVGMPSVAAQVVVAGAMAPCATCGMAMRAGTKECPHCGAQSTVGFCDACKMQVHPDASICPHCRTPRTPTRSSSDAALALPGARKPCQACKELINIAAEICPHCGAVVASRPQDT